MNIGLGLTWALALCVGVFSTYMLMIVVGAWLRRLKPHSSDNPLSFVVIIPAHNEEQGIGQTVTQLRRVEYPPEKVRIIVIADNCTDATAERAEQAGAIVMRRSDSVNRGKGQALDWILREHKQLIGSADLVAFIDADMNVDAGFFAAMAAAFSEPDVRVAQGRYIVANPARSALSAIGFTSFCYVNHVRPAGRCFWGGTADLKGSGMVFRTEFLLPRGWGAHSIAEDVQLGKELMLEGIRVMYVPAALVTSDIPATLSQVAVQQSRWEGGKRAVFSNLVPTVIRAFCRRPSKLLLDGLLDLSVPSLSIVVLLCVVGFVLSWWLGSVSVWVFLASILTFSLAVLTGLVQNRASFSVYGRLLAIPGFFFWKLLLLARVAWNSAPTEWRRTPRDPR